MLERSPRKRKVGCSNPSRDRPKSIKQVVTDLSLNARQQVRVSRVLADDHYKRMPNVTLQNPLKNPHCSIAMNAEYRSKLAALQLMVTSPYE